MRWPESLAVLTDRLEMNHDKFAVVVENDHSSKAISKIIEQCSSANIGRLATEGTEIISEATLRQKIGESVTVMNLGILFHPEYSVEPVSFFRQLAITNARIVVWPGEWDGVRLLFGPSQNSDRFVWRPENIVLLTPIQTNFYDDVPYEERWIN